MYSIDELFTKFQAYPRPAFMGPRTHELMYSLVLAAVQSLEDDHMSLADVEPDDPYILGVFTPDEARFILENEVS